MDIPKGKKDELMRSIARQIDAKILEEFAAQKNVFYTVRCPDCGHEWNIKNFVEIQYLYECPKEKKYVYPVLVGYANNDKQK